MLSIYTIFTFSLTNFGLAYKIINAYMSLSSLAIMKIQFLPRTIFAYLVEALFLALFFVIMIRSKKIGKKA